jgi:hypothetical protein
VSRPLVRWVEACLLLARCFKKALANRPPRFRSGRVTQYYSITTFVAVETSSRILPQTAATPLSAISLGPLSDVVTKQCASRHALCSQRHLGKHPTELRGAIEARHRRVRDAQCGYRSSHAISRTSASGTISRPLFISTFYPLCDRNHIASEITLIIIKRVTASPRALRRLHSGIFCTDRTSLCQPTCPPMNQTHLDAMPPNA